MISVDISNIWCSVSLPDLLASEKTIFDAHMVLGGGEQKKNNPWFSWLDGSDEARRMWVNPVVAAAEKIRQTSQILVVVGGGLPAAAAQAAIRMQPGRSSSVRLLFVGDDYSTDKWLRAVGMLENTDFSVLVTTQTGNETAPLITLRALRWIMDKRYGAGAKDRIYVSAGNRNSALIRLAESLGYTQLPMPEAPGAAVSSLNPAALLIMAAAGMGPGLICAGAAEMAASCDIRSFDNPVWLYAAARVILREKGIQNELICTPETQVEALAGWWLRAMAAAGNKDGSGIFMSQAKLPQDFFMMGDALLQPGHFATLLRLPLTKKKAAIEMDWKDLDGLGGLVGQDLSFVEGKTLETITDAFVEKEVPLVTIECDEEMTDDKVGEFLCFVEMAAAISAQAMGVSPTARRDVPAILQNLDCRLGRNCSNP